MSKGEASCAVGRGSDGTGGGNIFWGKPLQPYLRGLESTVSVVAEAGGGPSGKDRVREVPTTGRRRPMKSTLVGATIVFLGGVAAASAAEPILLWVEGENATRSEIHHNAWFDA